MAKGFERLYRHGWTNHDTADYGEVASSPKPIYTVWCKSYECSQFNRSNHKGRLILPATDHIPFKCPECGSRDFIHTKKINGLRR
jgi:hypothetical protein